MVNDPKNILRLLVQQSGIGLIKPKLFNVPEAPEGDVPADISYLGTPVFANTKLKLNREPFTEIVINTAIVTVDQPKLIVRTDVQGLNGSIKEYISDGDSEIVIEGALVSEFGENFPQDQLDIFREIVDDNQSIQILGEFYEYLGIFEAVVTSRSYRQSQFRNMQFFTLELLSDRPVELKVIEQGTDEVPPEPLPQLFSSF